MHSSVLGKLLFLSLTEAAHSGETTLPVDLVRITTRDGIQLDGCLQRPVASSVHAGIDAWCLVHGTGGNFYQSSLFDFLTEKLLGLGAAVLRINTRGHDGISSAVTAKGGVR